MKYMSLKERLKIPEYNNPDEIILGEVDFDYKKCTGCGMCVKICPGSALAMEGKKPVMRQPPDNQCMFCADCQAICPVDAIIMKKPFRWSGYYKCIEHGEPKPPRL
jgi:ferredoxin